MVELCSCDRDHIAHNAWNICHLMLYRDKNIPTLGPNHNFASQGTQFHSAHESVVLSKCWIFCVAGIDVSSLLSAPNRTLPIPCRLTPGSLFLIISGFCIHIDGPSAARSGVCPSLVLHLYPSYPLPSSSLTETRRKAMQGKTNTLLPVCFLSLLLLPVPAA